MGRNLTLVGLTAASGTVSVLALIGALSILAGCAEHPAPLPAPVPPVVTVKTVCPAIKAYSAEDEKALGAAVAALAPSSPLVGAMVDYGALRAKLRAC